MAEITIRGVTKRYDDDVLAVDGVDLDVADGELLVLVGPSGCGKSTLLRMVAGLEEPTGGQIAIDGRDVTYLPPRDRDIAMVFQSYALYPHLTVGRNIAYPLKLARVPKAEIDERVQAMARLLHLEEVLDRKPAHLSGGQRQRVAMGRALVRAPQGFLMDEPLSNLDAKLRVEMRAEIARLQRSTGVTTLYVTHDQVEAMTMGDRVAVLDHGRIQQLGSPRALYEQPINLFVASFIGSPAMNLFNATLEADGPGLNVDLGWLRLPVDGDHFDRSILPALDRQRSGGRRSVIVGLRPEAFTDASMEPSIPGERVADAEVDLVESLGAELLVHVVLRGGSAIDPNQIVSHAIETVASDATEIVTHVSAASEQAGRRPAVPGLTKRMRGTSDDEEGRQRLQGGVPTSAGVPASERDISPSSAGSRVIARLSPRSRVCPGDTVKLVVDTEQLHLFDPTTGESLRRAVAP